MMWKQETNFPEALASLCCQHYDKKLSKRGKPQIGKEWTLMSAVGVTCPAGKFTFKCYINLDIFHTFKAVTSFK